MQARVVGENTELLFGMPHVDLFNIGRLLIPGMDLKMRSSLNDPAFFMNAAGAVNVRLQAGDLKMKLFACMVKVISDVYNNIAIMRIERNLNVYYPTVRSEIRAYTLTANHINFEATNVFNGRLPDRVVVALMHQDCFTDAYTRNPLNFIKAKISSVKQLVEGEEYLYLPLEINGDNDQRDM